MNTKGRYSADITTIKFEDIEILGQELGKGAFAKVYTVKYRGVTYAAKEIHELLQSGMYDRSRQKQILKENFIRECDQCSKLSHPNIVHVIGIYYKPQQSLPVMVMEEMDESLTVYVERLPETAVKRVGPILLDVAEGLKYLHAQKPDPIVHRDLSPNNVMLLKVEKEITVAKIGDLGLARAISLDTKHMRELTMVPGTKDFMPPEAFKDTPDYNTSLDVFSYGAVTLYVANRKWPTPVDVREFNSTGKLIALTEIQRRQIYLDRIKGEMEELKPLIEDCLSYHTHERPTMLKVTEELKSLKQKGILFEPPGKDRSELVKKCINSDNKNSGTMIATACNDHPLKMPQRDTPAILYSRSFSAGSVNSEKPAIQCPPRVSATVSDKGNLSHKLSVNSVYHYTNVTKNSKDSIPSTSVSTQSGVNVGNINDSKNIFKTMLSHSEHYIPDVSVGLSYDFYEATVSVGSVQNEQYSLGTQPCSDHGNEDMFIVHSNKYSLCMCVFDGHDGLHAVKFVKKYMEKYVLGKPVWDDMTKSNKPEEIKAALGNYIQKADDYFFKSIEPFTAERQKLRSEIPKELTIFQLCQMFPVQVARLKEQVTRLKELRSHISGGCTAVMALLINDKLYVANVGNSRALLIYKERDGPLQVKQLSVDHCVENEQELERLTALGLDGGQLKKSGGLGTQENTRSIGDHFIKGGYKDVDVLSHATNQPGIAIPHVTSVDVNACTFKYIIVMSGGVYKTLEAIDGSDTKKSGNTLIVDMVNKHITKKGWNDAIAVNILQEICQTHCNLYQISASKDAHSLMAVANNKRDDMTLVICNFNPGSIV